MPPAAVRLAMWSGPRNISTALMRSWANRADTFATDEPLYAHYLQSTGLDHPMAAQIIEHYQTDLGTLLAWITGPVPTSKRVWFQKHMTHHVPNDLPLDFLDQLTNCFLLRDPAEMLTSLLNVLPHPALDETGLPQQVRLFEHVAQRTGNTPPVLDAKDVLLDPPQMLRKLCARVGVPFDDAMLQWTPGRHACFGLWAPAWYDKVERSTGFAPYVPKREPVPPAFESLHREACRLYQSLHAHRIVRE